MNTYCFLFTLEIVTTWILVCKYGMIVVKFPKLKCVLLKFSVEKSSYIGWFPKYCKIILLPWWILTLLRSQWWQPKLSFWSQQCQQVLETHAMCVPWHLLNCMPTLLDLDVVPIMTLDHHIQIGDLFNLEASIPL